MNLGVIREQRGSAALAAGGVSTPRRSSLGLAVVGGGNGGGFIWDSPQFWEEVFCGNFTLKLFLSVYKV